MAFVEKTGMYRRHTHLWHIMAAMASLAIGYFMMHRNTSDGEDMKHSFIVGECFLSVILFTIAFAFYFGMTMWVTFVAGIVMFKNLPTHTFGHIQSKLFPLYFLIGAITGLVMFLIAIYSTRNVEELSKEQTTLLICTAMIFFTNLANGMFVGPRSTAIMFRKHRLEKECEDKDALNDNAEYKSLKKSFGAMHGISSLLNIFSLGGACFILYWIASQLASRN